MPRNRVGHRLAGTIEKKRKRSATNQEIDACLSNKKRKIELCLTIPLEAYSWSTVETSILSSLRKTETIDLDLKTWMKPIMDSYVNNWKFSINSEELTANVYGDGLIMHEFMQKDRTCISPKRLDLTCIISKHPKTSSIFHAQFAFKIERAKGSSFMVILQRITNYWAEFVDIIKINDVEVRLKRISGRKYYCDDGSFAEYYMGDGTNNKRYSYLSSFEKLFLSPQQQFAAHMRLEFRFKYPRNN